MFKCRLCPSSFKSIEDHYRHIDLNHTTTSNPAITCGFQSCTAKVRGVAKYHQHYKEFHSLPESSDSECDQPCYKCAFPGCNYTTKSRSTLRSHLFWRHPKTNDPDPETNDPDPVASGPNVACGSSNIESEESFFVCEPIDVSFQASNEPSGQPPIVVQENTEDPEETLLKKMVHMNITANTKYHVPDSTLGFMIEGYRRLLFESAKISEKVLKAELELLGHSDAVSQKISDKVLFEPGLLKLHGVDGPLRSRHMRKKQYSILFPSYVAPTPHNLGLNDKNKKCKYHTVSLKESLQSLFEDDSVYEQWKHRQSVLLADSDDLSDICHGSIFKNHALFSTDPSALQLIFFQDDVEMGNSIGPSGGMYKLLHMAYILGNIFPWNRSKVDPIQLALLCKDEDVSYFGLPRILEPVITELKELEEIGVEIRGEMVKGSILVILGDNLGTHTIGGYSAGFSKSHYFCRYCVESREEWKSRWFPTIDTYEESSESDSSSSDSSSSDESCAMEGDEVYESHESEHSSSTDDDVPLSVLREKVNRRKNMLRTKESYDESVKKLKDNPNGVLGVVANCAFNDLKYFHIVNGCPPCCAHDILEGVVPYDLMLCIKKLMRGKFSFDYLNRKLKSFPFKGSDALDRPPSKFHSQRKKVKGGAVQNWVLLRFLPLLIGGRVEKENNEVWDMVLSLDKVVALRMSPVIARSSLGFIDSQTQGYLQMRATLFPKDPFKCKHHYFEHGSDHIEMWGPECRSSTLRCESKHKFYRSEARAKKCMKNITKTLSTSHQRFQSSLKVGELFPSCPIVECPTSYDMLDVSEEVTTCLLSSFGKDYVKTLLFAKDLMYHNTHYKAGDTLVTSTSDYPEIACCRISLLVSDGKFAYAVGKCCAGQLIENMQVFEVLEKSKVSIYALDTLKDFVPYPTYQYRDKSVIVLKHLYLKK